MSDYPNRKKTTVTPETSLHANVAKKDRFKMLLQQNALLNSYQINMEKV